MYHYYIYIIMYQSQLNMADTRIVCEGLPESTIKGLVRFYWYEVLHVYLWFSIEI